MGLLHEAILNVDAVTRAISDGTAAVGWFGDWQSKSSWRILQAVGVLLEASKLDEQ